MTPRRPAVVLLVRSSYHRQLAVTRVLGATDNVCTDAYRQHQSEL
jgi:hypothetical protein